MFATIDLFAGAGGLSFGFRQTGKFDIKAAFESDPTIRATYKKNHPDVEVFGDVCEADYIQLQEKFGPIDVVIGGPPCQGFSNANRQKNHAVSHNNSMVKEYIRAIIELRPRAFVMENVSMLNSDVHRFYSCKDDIGHDELEGLKKKKTKLLLLDKEYMFDGVSEMIKNPAQVCDHLWTDSDFHELNVVFKATKNIGKLSSVLERHKKNLLKAAESHISVNSNDAIYQADSEAFEAVQMYFDEKFEIGMLRDAIKPAIMYQRMLERSREIFNNDFVGVDYRDDDGVYVEIQSYAVYDYFNAKLNEYKINSGVLCAADFGVPQKRMRFVAIGIRRDETDEVKLPVSKFDEAQYRTVLDAIGDLSDVPPLYDTREDTGITLEKKDVLSDLALLLRDSPKLYNHVVTKTTDIVLQRFHKIEQGKNFHSLSENMKTNTYTDISRTQNTIYLRLKYDEPSGTVVNVRKSMWIHPTIDRAISIREAARLQSFRDSFVFVGTKDKQYQQVGNAVPPIMAEEIANALAEQLETISNKYVGND